MEENFKQGRLFIGVTGGTASGKTSLTLRIGERFPEN